MDDEIKLNELRAFLSDFAFPVTKQELMTEVGSVTLHYADGSERLEAVLERTSTDAYRSIDDLEAEIFNNLPTEAVGEPGQAEGEG